jgi:hypothetical protein
MALLREAPTQDAVTAMNQRLAAKRARDAFDRRLDQLEAEHAAFQSTLARVERAVRVLSDRDRPRARRRLRALGHDAPLDALENLRDAA